MKKGIYIFLSISMVIMFGYYYVQKKTTTKLSDITSFKLNSQKRGEYLVFSLKGPYDQYGYISEVGKNGKEIYKYIVNDKRFSATIPVNFNNKFYLDSSYSSAPDIIVYDPSNHNFSFIDTNQEKQVINYYQDDVSAYIVTAPEIDDQVCDINSNKCVPFPKDYMATHVRSLDDSIITICALINSGDVNNTLLRKYDRNLNLQAEIMVDETVSNVVTVNNYLYLLLHDGNIVRIDNNLETAYFSLDFSELTNDIYRVSHGIPCEISKGKILTNIKIDNSKDERLPFLVTIDFTNDTPILKKIAANEERVLNTNTLDKEVYSVYYDNDIAHIVVRSTETLEIKKTIKLRTTDSIYLISKI